MYNFKFIAKVTDKLESKKISDKTTKDDYLVEFGERDKSGRKSIAVLSVFSFLKNKFSIKDIKIGNSYLFEIAIDGRQLAGGKFVNNLKILNVEETTEK